MNYIEIQINAESVKHSENVFRYELNSIEQQEAREIISGKRIIDNKHFIKDCTLARLLFAGHIKGVTVL